MIEVVAETGSTNATLAARIAGGEPVSEGRWLVADRQTQGRGRQGRAWSDGAGNFMGSTVAVLRGGDPAPHTLSLVAGVALFAAVEAVAPGIEGLELKWPNDLLLQDAKLAGILLERIGDSVIVGVGVNLRTAPDVPGRAVASLQGAGYAVGRDAFAQAVDASWERCLDLWHGGGWNALRQEWVVRAHRIGTALSVHGADGEPVRGTFAGVNSEGALQLDLGGSTTRTIHAGEVVLDRR